MGAFKQITDKLSSWALANTLVNSVSKGDLNDVDTSGETDLPLVHINYGSADYQEDYTVFTYQVLALDKYDDSVDVDKLDILDSMNQVLTDLVFACRQGALFKSYVRIQTEPTAEVLYDQFRNRLYGWSLDISVTVPSGAINPCK